MQENFHPSSLEITIYRFQIGHKFVQYIWLVVAVIQFSTLGLFILYYLFFFITTTKFLSIKFNLNWSPKTEASSN